MTSEAEKVKDPVCEMWVDPEKNRIEFEGLHFAFCSNQCRERFLANPHLYIGSPGTRAPKQLGEKVFKHRRLKLAGPVSPTQADTLAAAIRKMMGIKHIAIDGDSVDIIYDLLEATEAQIEIELQQAGAALGDNWAERLRRAFVNYLEETQVDSLEVQAGHRHHHH